MTTGKQRFRAAARRERGGANELFMLNGRIGTQQPGNIFVKWIEIEGPLPAATRNFPAAKLASSGGGKILENGDRLLDKNGKVSTTISAANDGDYILRAQAYANQAGSEPARMEFLVDGKPLKTFDVLAPGNMKPLPRQKPFSPALLLPQPQFYEFKTKLPPGEHQFSAAFVNAFSDPTNSNPNLHSRNLVIRSLEVADLSAPVLIPPMSEIMQAYFAKPPAPGNEREAAREILGQFAFRAWRRPVAPDELDRLMKLYDLRKSKWFAICREREIADEGRARVAAFSFSRRSPARSRPAGIGSSRGRICAGVAAVLFPLEFDAGR